MATTAGTTAVKTGSPGRPALPLDRMLAAALRIVDDEGVDALTMRRLAGVLDTGTATLYRHFSSRTDLIAQVVDRLFRDVRDEMEAKTSADWLDALRGIAQHMFAVLGRHRDAALLLLDSVPSGPNAALLRERCLAALLADGFSAELAALAYASVARFVLGFAIQVAAHHPPTDRSDGDIATRPDPSALPATAAVGDALPVPLDAEFAFALELMLEGLDRRRATKR